MTLDTEPGGSVLIAGVDLAWQSDRNPSALALGHLENDTVTVSSLEPRIFGVNAVFEVLNCFSGLSGVAIDAPLIIGNRTGQRSCEKAVGRVYGSRGASCHTSNTRLYPNAGSVQLSEKLQRVGFAHLEGERWQIECYPHPAIIEVFGLQQRLKYKKGRVSEKKAGQGGLAAALQRLRHSKVLRLEIPSQYEHCFNFSYIDSLAGKTLKSNEDVLDSIVCLYTAGLYANQVTGTLFGDIHSGYIWVPNVKCT